MKRYYWLTMSVIAICLSLFALCYYFITWRYIELFPFMAFAYISKEFIKEYKTAKLDKPE